MKTEKKNCREVTKTLRVKSNNYKTSCPGVLAAKKGFSLAELITVIVIIAILIGVLLPALSQVKKFALEAKQKAQITSVEAGIQMYKNDFGAYPPSQGDNQDGLTATYGGAQTLVEAMFGQDLMGYRTDSDYRNDGKDNSFVTDATRRYIFSTMSQAQKTATLVNRHDPYLDRANIGLFTPKQIFGVDTYAFGFQKIVSDRYTICDVFTAVSRDLDVDEDGTIDIRNAKIGTPLLYFRANPSALNTELIFSETTSVLEQNIYNWRDNYNLIFHGKITKNFDINNEIKHPMFPATVDGRSGKLFFKYIHDPMIPIIDPTNTWGTPLKKGSFILISAGYDGLYGTKDDICNFTPTLPLP